MEPLAAFSVFERLGCMQRNNLSVIRDYIVRYCKIIFPVLVVAVVAVTVSLALNLNRERARVDEESSDVDESLSSEGSEEVMLPEEIPEIPLMPNEDSAIYTLVATYYNALGTGDMETLASLYDTITDSELLRNQALSEYLDHYAELQVNTKQGPVAGSVIAYIYYRVCFVNHDDEFPGYEMLYICTNEDGSLYIKNESNFTEDDIEYITAISSQADVIEFNNRVTVEYNELVMEDHSLLEYLNEVANQVDIDYGLALAEQNQTNPVIGEGENGEEGQEGGDTQATPEPEPEAVPTPEYATATTTVNVRNSDSEQADKVGKVSAGTRLQVQEVFVNGWTKVVYEGADGYIKSDYLQFAESASGQQVIGTVTANTNINVRAAASETAEKLGMLTGGESLDLLAVESGWCKVVFSGQVAYVKAEYVQQHTQ